MHFSGTIRFNILKKWTIIFARIRGINFFFLFNNSTKTNSNKLQNGTPTYVLYQKKKILLVALQPNALMYRGQYMIHVVRITHRKTLFDVFSPRISFVRQGR